VKKNVLQFIGSFHQGGSERQAVQLTRLLAEDGTYRVFAACLNGEGVLRPEIERLAIGEIPEFPLKSFYDLNFLRQLRRCAKFLRENKIEIVHTHDFYTNVFGIAAASLAGVPVKIASKRETGGMRGKLQKAVEKQMFRRADAITVNSEAVKKYLIWEGVRAEKISVVYNGLDLERLQPRTTDRRAICEKFGLPADENIKFIAMVANLRHAVKNQPMFLRSARRVLDEFPNAHFVLAGEGELRENLENLAKDLKISENVHFTGRCEIIAELLFISHACVLSSYAEGFSNSILEYMAAARPVVATNVGGASEAIVEGETGFLVESNDDKAMAEKILELLKNESLAKEMGEKGKIIAQQKFSLESQLENIKTLYEALPDKAK
jgi:L-malate glycosyltransferase